MREIKFKGIDKANGKWISGNLEIPLSIQDMSRKYIMGYSYGHYQKHEVNPKSIAQFTGIKDKERNEIYEDDILQEDKTGKLFRCEWVDKLASFKLVLMTDSETMFGMSVAGSFTVVGNVHEMGVE